MDDLFGSSARVLTVAELTRAIRGTLETKFGAVWVQGEVSNYKLHPSGHQYFTLKDQRAQIACVIFRNTLPPSARPIVDGAQVQVYGNVSVFEARGQYQLSVQIVQTRGAGLLQAKFEALKRKLEAEGLFAAARKRPLPKFPKRIGIVTSPSGAAIRDVLNVLQRRAPNVQILINPVRVQGPGAGAEIATAIHELNEPSAAWPAVDLIVITRGGGSIEDLWEFNEEIVARAIFHSAIPIVSAVGHEIDFTIADFVADLRAPTPSAAAELIVPDAGELNRRIGELANCVERCFRRFVEHERTRLRSLSERTLGRELSNRLRDAQQQLDFAQDRLGRRAQESLAVARTRLMDYAQRMRAHNPRRELISCRRSFAEIERRLAALPPRFVKSARHQLTRVESVLRILAPEATLLRGYSITKTAEGRLIRSTGQASAGLTLLTRVADGEFASVVQQKTAPIKTRSQV